MKEFLTKIDVRWSDLDPNFHMLHSKYYDLGAHCRISFLSAQGIGPAYLQEHHIGPILFREECVFKRELSFGDEVFVKATLLKATADAARWTMLHEIWKNEQTLAAVITCDGAWIDTNLRKLVIPGSEIQKVFEEFPKADGFFIYNKNTNVK